MLAVSRSRVIVDLSCLTLIYVSSVEGMAETAYRKAIALVVCLCVVREKCNLLRYSITQYTYV